MKIKISHRWIVCLSIISVCSIGYADELCDQALAEGKQKYNTGQYAKAKDLFDFVISECGTSYGESGTWVSKCNTALNNTPAPVVQTSHVSAGRESVSTNMSTSAIPTNSTTQSSTQTSSTGLNQSTQETKIAAPAIYESQRDNSRQNNSRQNSRKQSAPPSAEIKSVTAKQDVVQNGEKGMLLKITFEVSNMAGQEGICAVWLQNVKGEQVYDNDSTPVCAYHLFTPSQKEQTYSNIELFMPYSAIPSEGEWKYVVSLNVREGAILLTKSEQRTFTYKVPHLTVNGQRNVVSSSLQASTGTLTYTIISPTHYKIEHLPAWCYLKQQNDHSLSITYSANKSRSARYDYFDVICGTERVRVNLSQSGKLSAMQRFNARNGRFEVMWWEMRALIGTSLTYEHNMFGFRWSWFELDPFTVGASWQWIDTHEKAISFSSYPEVYWQPTIKVLIPFNDKTGLTLAGAPVFRWNLEEGFDLGRYRISYMGELGIHYHWGRAGSSDFFIRYDGNVKAGISLDLTSGHRRY